MARLPVLRMGLAGQALLVHGLVKAMATEIERKFLVSSETWRQDAVGISYTQGYICREPGRTVRIRISGGTAFLTIKGAVQGISRPEFEYQIPLDDAEELLLLCHDPVIKKRRFKVLHEGYLWEVDEFEGANSGLIVAEIELLNSEQTISLPDWLGEEVTGNVLYNNSNLTIHPYSQWRDDTA